MAAPSIAVLLDYEGNYETALRAYFAAIYPSYQVLTAETLATSEPKLTTPRLEIQLTITGTGTAENDRNTDSAVYSSEKTATLRLRAVAKRNDPRQRVGLMRGQIRAGMLEATLALDNTAMPYYQTSTITEAGCSRQIDADNDEVQTDIEYHIAFWIRPDVWPVS